jgi:nitrite reductase (NADH) small subunit
MVDESDVTVITVPLSDIPDGGAHIVEVCKGFKLALFRVNDRVAAVNNRCPHASAALGDGDFDGATVVCPLHGYRFNVWNGAGYKTLKTYRTEVVQDQVRISVPM